MLLHFTCLYSLLQEGEMTSRAVVDLSNSFIQINRQTVCNFIYNDSNLLQLWTALQISMQL